MDTYLSAKQIALRLGISRRATYRLLHSLPRVRVGRCLRISEADLDAYLEQHREKPWDDSIDAHRTARGGATGQGPAESASNEVSARVIASSPVSDSERPNWLRPLRRTAARKDSARRSTT